MIKPTALNAAGIRKHYYDPLVTLGEDSDSVIAFDVFYNGKKAPAKQAKAYLSTQLLPALDKLQTQTLLVADGQYFKYLTGEKKSEPHYGYVKPCKIKDFEHFQVVLVPNYQALVYNPDLQAKIDMGLKTLRESHQGTYEELGSNIIQQAIYLKRYDEIRNGLDALLNAPELTVDVETFSLQFWKAGIGTICFNKDKHNGAVIKCDYSELSKPQAGYYGGFRPNDPVRRLLKLFFEKYEGKIVFHNANFDMKVMVYTLFMRSDLDMEGMLHGIETLTKNFDDTKLISYLALNSTSEVSLSLKDLAHAFAGNYAQSDINDIRKIPLEDLMQYNLVDGLSTWFVYEKYYQKMVDDQQLNVYETIFKPSVPVLLHMELCGMPLNMDNVADARNQLENTISGLSKKLSKYSFVQDFVHKIRVRKCAERNAALKTKQVKITDDEFQKIVFNPNSNPQLQELIYTELQYKVIDKTAEGQPSCGGKTLKKLINVAKTKEHIEFFNDVIDVGDAAKILNTFIKAMEENSFMKEDGNWYMHGNFNLGGTVSGRMSSSKPNLQNLPSSGTRYAKLVKSCFQPGAGLLFVGADFALI